MRNWKRIVTAILGCLLCIVVVNPVSAAEKFKNPIYKGVYEETEYDYVDYGLYPQREITGDNLTKEIMNASYNEEGDAVVNGNFIKRISVDEVRGRMDTALSNSWKDKVYRYYKYEPIQWRVLNCDGNSLMLLSEKVLDYQYYNRAKTGSWDESQLKQWLNSSFLEQAFTKNEQEKLLGSTGEKVTLPSGSDILNKAYGFVDKKDVLAVSRRAWTSDYAESVGAPVVTEGNARENTYWSTKDFKNDNMIYVQFDGQVKELPISTSSLACVRPMIRISVDDSVKSSVYLRNRILHIETLDKYKLKLYSSVSGDRIIKAVSSKPHIAAVSNSGTITALKRGETNITVTTRSGRILECYVFVNTPHTELNVETVPLQIGKSTTAVKVAKKEIK